MPAKNATIGALRVELGLDSAQYNAGLKDARGQLLSFKKGVGGALDELKAGFGSSAKESGVLGAALSSMGLAGVAAGAGLAAVATAVVAARKAFTFAGEIANEANRLAVSTKALQEYRFAVHSLGGEYQDADKALEGFSKAFGAARSGVDKRSIKPFQALFGPNFDPKQFATTEEALQAVIEKISRLSSTAEQASIADRLGLSAMLPALRAGSSAIDEARAAAERLGFVMDDALVQKGGAANDKLEDLGKVLEVQVNSALVDLAPIILAVGEKFVQAATGIANFANNIGHLIDSIKGSAFGQAIKRLNDLALAGGFGSNPIGDFMKGMASRQAAPKATREGVLAAMAPKPLKADGRLHDIPDAGAAKKAEQFAKASKAAVEDAIKDELSARLALVGDLEQRAALEALAVDVETKAKNDLLLQRVVDKEIDGKKAELAIALNKKTAGEQKALIQQQMEQKISDQLIEQRDAIASYYDRIGSIAASMAGTAAERNAIETKNLANQQQNDALDLKLRVDGQVARKEIVQKDADGLIAAQKDLQAREHEAQFREQLSRLAEETLAKAQAAFDLQIDIQNSLLPLARSSAKRREIEARILDLQQKAEKVALQAAAAGPDKAAAAIATAHLGEIDQIHANEKAALALHRSYDDTSNALDDAAQAFKNEDWSGMVNGLVGAFDSLSQAFSAAGTAADKAGAIAAVANSVGNIIGGTTGKAIAATAKGGVLGGIASLISSAKAKKAAKLQQQNADAQDAANKANVEAQRLQDVAAQKRELEISLMEDAGDAVGALAARRADELGAMDPSLHGLQLMRYAFQDAAAAADNLAKVQEEGAQKVSAAKDVLETAYARESTALKDTIATAGAAAKSLRDYGKALAGGSAGQLSISAQLKQASAAFASIVAANDNAGLQDASDGFLKALAAAAPDQLTLAKGVAKVRAAVEAAATSADDQASIAEQQLSALNDSVGGLIEINKSVITVAEAIASLGQVIAATKAANDVAAAPVAAGPVTPTITPTPQADNGPVTDFVAYVDNHQDLLDLWNSHTGMARGRTKEQFGQYHYANYGSKEGRTTTGVRGFKDAGSFMVGGSGGTDSQLTQMRTTPGEMVSVSHGDPFSGMDGVRREVAALRGDLMAVNAVLATNTRKTARILDRWDGDGLPVERAA